MREFDDDDLGRRLRAAAGEGPDVDTALQSVRRGVVRVRRRRMAAVSGAAAVVIVALGLIVTVGNDPSDRITGSPGGTDSASTASGDSSSSSTSSTSTAPSSSSSTSDPRGPATTITTVVSTPLPTAPAVLPSSSPTTTTTMPGHVPGDPSTTSTTSTTSTSVPDQTTTTQALSADPQTFASAGGQIVVGVTSGHLQLGAITDATGFTHDVHQQQADDVEVRFTSADTEWRIRVRLIDGQMQSETSQH
jgi:hypothetical protein